jgi:catechol 2,3-dioxygenase-like lactoylglutathione lyase family enzyme
MLTLAKPSLDVGIVPADVDGMKAFYADVLGLEVQGAMPLRDGELVRHGLGGSTVKLYCTKEQAERAKGGMHHTIGYRLVTIILPAIDDVLDRAAKAGKRISRIQHEGMDVAFLTDADGNLLELVGVEGATPSVQVGMSVSSHDATKAFYVDQLGLTEQPDQEFDGRTRHAALFGTTTLKWFEADAGAPAHTGPITARAGIRYITAWVTGLEDAVAALQAKGVTFPVGLTDIGVARIAIASDPDGSWVELVEAAS